MGFMLGKPIAYQRVQINVPTKALFVILALYIASAPDLLAPISIRTVL